MMTSEAEVRALRQAPSGAWPPDDTEESVVGTDLHQTTIINLHLGLSEAAELQRESGRPVPWKVLTQTVLLGCERPDGSAYRTLPDIFVYLHTIDPNRPSVALSVDGPPVLIVEVLSPSTYDIDLNIDKGKGYSYARAGVQEYIALDPVRQFVQEGGRAWRLVEGTYQPWLPDSHHRWRSEVIPIAIGLEGVMATVYTNDGHRVARVGEVEGTIRRQAEEIQDLRRRLQDLTQSDR